MIDRAKWFVVGSFVLLMAAACLPEDDRPPPGRVRFEVSADRALRDGFTTEDGWSIAYERFWVSLGGVRLFGDECNPFTDTTYTRVIDLRLARAQTLATVFGNGQCALGFQLDTPSSDAALGVGVDRELRTFLAARASDALVSDHGSVLHVSGNASRQGNTLHFAWSFRQPFDYLCDALRLQTGEMQNVEIDVRTALLFRSLLDDANAELRFDPYAAADLDGDGDITLDELATIPALDGASAGALLRWLYFGVVPSLVRVVDSRPCTFAPLGGGAR